MKKLILFLTLTIISIKFYAQTIPINGNSKIAAWSQNRDSAGFTTVALLSAQVAAINGGVPIGTANRITVTGSTTPVIDISAAYVGQASITTLGTITTGIWNGTAIANANLANSTISGVALGGTLAPLVAGANLTGTNYTGAATQTFALATTLTGLTSVTSTTFVGALTGNASTATSATNVTGLVASSNGGTGVAGTLTGYLYGNAASPATASTTIPTTALSGTITNAQLANNSITLNGASVALGGSKTIDLANVTSVGATTATATSFTGGLTSSGGTTLSGSSGAATISGAITNTQSIKTAVYTVLLTDREIVADATSGAFTITLPACSAGREIIIIRKNMTGSNVTITRAGTDTINTNALFTLMSAGVLVLKGMGTDWITNFSN